MQTIRTQVLLKQIEPEKTSAGGLILTTNYDTTYAEVVARGNDVDETVKIGSKVVVNWNAAVPIRVGNDTFFCVDHSGIYMVL